MHAMHVCVYCIIYTYECVSMYSVPMANQSECGNAYNSICPAVMHWSTWVYFVDVGEIHRNLQQGFQARAN